MILYCVVTSLLNALCSLALGVAAFLKDRRNPLNVTFAFLSVSVALWAGPYFWWQISDDPGTALVCCRLLSVGAIAIPITYYHFVLRLLRRGPDHLALVGYVLLVGFTLLAPFPVLVAGVEPKLTFPWWPEPGPLYPAYLIVFAVYIGLAWRLVIRAYRTSTNPRERNQYRWVLVGTTFGILGGATNFPLWFDIPVPPYGNGLVAVYVVGVGYAIIRLRLLEVDYALVKFFSYAFAIVPLALVFPALFLLVRAYTADAGQQFALNFAGSAVVTLTLFWLLPPLKRRVDELLASTILRDRYERRGELRALADRITSMRDDDAMCRETVRTVHDVLKAPAVIYLRGDSDTLFSLREAAGFETGRLPPSMPLEASVLRWLSHSRKTLVFDEVASARVALGLADVNRRSVVEFGQATGSALAVPIIGDVFFFGTLLVGHRPQRLGFGEHDLDLLDSICGHIGLSLRARQLERRANQVEKLISLGTLAAGLAHELRNPLVSIQTFVSLLAESRDGGVPTEFTATVQRDVRRIAGIVENVSAFATNNQVTFAWVTLDEVVKQAYEIVTPDFAEAKVDFDLISERVQPVYANQNQLLQVVINLLNNAVQALRGRERARVVVSLRSISLEDNRPGMEIAVSDNGPGIDPEILPRMFEPFTTTKATGTRSQKGGMGLGLAIVKRIIDGHNGLISVRNNAGAGATFVITLPCEAAGS